MAIPLWNADLVEDKLRDLERPEPARTPSRAGSVRFFIRQAYRTIKRSLHSWGAKWNGSGPDSGEETRQKRRETRADAPLDNEPWWGRSVSLGFLGRDKLKRKPALEDR